MLAAPSPTGAAMSKNPCIKVCEFDADICVGCGRSKREIKAWKKLDKHERFALLAEADLRLLAFEATGRRKTR
jgi:predicted Fe-S protein YdhL (DUF1289 family)